MPRAPLHRFHLTPHPFYSKWIDAVSPRTLHCDHVAWCVTIKPSTMTRDAEVTYVFIFGKFEARKRHPYAIVKSVRTTYSAEIDNNTVKTNSNTLIQARSIWPSAKIASVGEFSVRGFLFST